VPEPLLEQVSVRMPGQALLLVPRPLPGPLPVSACSRERQGLPYILFH
jgi:hypothetical protein